MADEIHRYLTKVLQSDEFQNSPKYQKLLEYLVHATLEGNIPKEITIAVELFGLDMKGETAGESNIRVYVHNLRKKLDSYYIKEGRNDRIQFKITKGRYKVEFFKKRADQRIFDRKSFFIIGSVVALLIVVDIILLRLSPDSGRGNSRYSRWIWKDFMSRETPLAIVIGDYYLLEDTAFSDRSRFLRDVRINSENDFDEFLLDYPEQSKTLSRTKHTFMGKYAPICIYKLGRLMVSSGTDTRIFLSSEFQLQDLMNHNVVYIGSFKSLGVLGQLIKNANFRFSLYPSSLMFHVLETDSVYHYYPSGSDIDNAYETDYCVVTKLPGANQKEVLLFISVRDIGLIATMDYFTEAETLQSFEKMLNARDQETDFFEACFRIEGLNRNSMGIYLIHLNRLSSTSLFEKNP